MLQTWPASLASTCPGIPQHVVQRGNNRLPCFLDDGDRMRYLQLLRESLATTHCRLHATS